MAVSAHGDTPGRIFKIRPPLPWTQTRAALRCSSHNAPCRPHPTATALAASVETFSDRAATSYGSEGWGFESLRARAASTVSYDAALTTRCSFPVMASPRARVIRVRWLSIRHRQSSRNSVRARARRTRQPRATLRRTGSGRCPCLARERSHRCRCTAGARSRSPGWCDRIA
jgi:hypothetical protein